MEIEIKKLTTELLSDWLEYFDSAVYFGADDDDWSGCYCMHFHWNERLDNRNDWNATLEQVYRKTGKADNRGRAIRLIKNGTMQGYLTYEAGKVVGWCNANEKNTYKTVLNCFFDSKENIDKIKSVACFCIDANMRGKGIATKLLEKVCVDASAEGYEYVEVYPYSHGQANDFHGPLRMFEKMGFERTKQKWTIVSLCEKNSNFLIISISEYWSKTRDFLIIRISYSLSDSATLFR